MKKNLGLLAMMGVALSTVSSFAGYYPNWERPILRAELEKLSVVDSGVAFPEPTIVLTLNQRDDSSEPTSLTLREQKVVYCFRAPCPPVLTETKFRIKDSESAGCGSVRYIAEQELSRPGSALVFRHLELVDHTKRVCEDYKPHTWIATIFTGSHIDRYVGNPLAVVTAQAE